MPGVFRTSDTNDELMPPAREYFTSPGHIVQEINAVSG
jgi:hypothetical protein